MCEQLNAKARKADTLAANKDFVAAAALAAECVALAESALARAKFLQGFMKVWKRW